MKSIRLTIKTNHGSLKWILILTDSARIVAYNRHRLSENEFNVVLHVGINDHTGGMLSYPQTTEEDCVGSEVDLSILVIDVTRIETENQIVPANCK